MKVNPISWSNCSLTGSARSALTLAGVAIIAIGCSGGSPGDPENRGDFKVVTISTGSGTVYPYRIRTTDQFGNPTTTVVNIESQETLKAHVTGNNGVLPVATLPTDAVLPDGNPGNHFLHFAFSHKLDVKSIISEQLADQAQSGLTGTLNLLGYDPSTETSATLKGRAFVNGITYYNVNGELLPVRAVIKDEEPLQGIPNAVDIVDEILDKVTLLPLNPRQFLTGRTTGFPNFAGAADLVTTKSFTFVADENGSLASFDKFPDDRLLRIIVTNGVRDSENDILEQEIGVATTVGPDPNPPQVLGYLSGAPRILPGNNQVGIDPTGSILIRFNKPVQPGEVGSFFDPTQFVPPSGGVSISVTAAAVTFPVIYHADPVSFGDLMNYIIKPAYNLPGDSPVDVTVQNTTITSLTGQPIGVPVSTRFTTGTGPGIVNAPVAPEAVYIGLGGSQPGVSVIDLNGFGQGTGDINNTRFPLNPNIFVATVPPMAPGTGNLDAGSGGALTLVKDTNLNTRLLRDPIVSDVTDIHIGAPLDLIFNNENINRNASRANQINQLLGQQMSGNTITQPPVPNPPRLIYPPPNPDRAIFAEEPSVKSSFGPPGALVTGGPPANCLAIGLNQLVQGNPFSSSQNELGLFGTNFMGVFVGPQPPPGSPPPPPPFCPYTSRQQVGHFLYVLDRDNRQVLVINSNRFTVLDSIQLSDPVSMAMAPDMTRLAVTNFASASVSFIDIDPTSQRFHEIVATTQVEQGPTGIAWQPDGEDILVVSTEANFLTIISALDFRVRRSLGGFLNGPVDIIVSERYFGHGNLGGVYYAYILNSNGTVAIYESGPDGVNGFGFNDMIGSVTNVSFPRAKAMFYDMTTGFGGVLVGHTDDSGLGMVSRLQLTSSSLGLQPINQVQGGFILTPTYRQKEWSVIQRFGGITPGTPLRDLMTGNSVIDLCTDDMVNFGGYFGQTNLLTPTNPATPYLHSGKHTVKVTPGGGLVPGSLPRLLFVALSDVGNVDVFELQTATRIATIDAPGVRVVSSYWRQ